MKIQTEDIAFSRDRMVTCGRCGKSNPPNRASCLYCAAALDIADDAKAGIRLNLRKLENWENGFNIVLTAVAEGAGTTDAARYLKQDVGQFEKLLSAKHPLPLARVESESEARIAVDRLAEFGLTSRIVRDVDLKMGKPNTRLRSVAFGAGTVRLTTFNTNEERTVGPGEIVLFVVGRIFESRAESVEKGKKDKRTVMAESLTSSDDLLIDVYTADTEQGWRVTTKGFDFSTLGSEKSLLAVDNIQLLLEKLKSFAREATVIEEYSDLIDPLSEVWDIERRTDFEGMKRTGVMKAGFASVARTSNLEQFSKYSRLQRILI